MSLSLYFHYSRGFLAINLWLYRIILFDLSEFEQKMLKNGPWSGMIHVSVYVWSHYMKWMEPIRLPHHTYKQMTKRWNCLQCIQNPPRVIKSFIWPWVSEDDMKYGNAILTKIEITSECQNYLFCGYLNKIKILFYLNCTSSSKINIAAKHILPGVMIFELKHPKLRADIISTNISGHGILMWKLNSKYCTKWLISFSWKENYKWP